MNLLLALLTPVFVYVANQASGKVTVINAANDSVVATVDFTTLGFSAHPKPHHIVVEPDGSYWYVSLVGDNAVVKLDRANHVVAKAETVTPGLLAIDPKSDVLYATRSMSAVNAPARIAVINRKTMAVEEVEVLVPRPHGVAVAPDGQHAYVASLGANHIAVYDAKRERVAIVEVPGDTSRVIVQLAVSPDGHTLVATAQLSAKLLVFDLADPAQPKLVQTVATGDWPWLVTFTPDGNEVWVPNQRSNDVTVIDAKRWSVITTVKGEFAQPDGIAISHDGRLVFVANHNTDNVMTMGGISMAMPMPGTTAAPGRLIVIDARKREVVRRVDTAPDGAGLGMGGGKP